jgi:hypothetical protein
LAPNSVAILNAIIPSGSYRRSRRVAPLQHCLARARPRL